MAETGEASSVPDADGPGRGDAAADGADESSGLSGRAKAGITIATLGVVLPGVADYVLAKAGAPGLGVLVWVVGFGTAIVALWYVLLRPMNIGAETEG